MTTAQLCLAAPDAPTVQLCPGILSNLSHIEYLAGAHRQMRGGLNPFQTSPCNLGFE